MAQNHDNWQAFYYEPHDSIPLNPVWDQQCVMLPDGYATTNPNARRPIQSYNLAPLSRLWTQPTKMVPKINAPAFLATSYAELDARDESSSHRGWYHAVFFDLDSGNIPAHTLAEALNRLDCAWLAFTTYSSSIENLRWRIAIPMIEHLTFNQYRAVIWIISNLLTDWLGVTPDKCMMRGKQLSFMPNQREKKDPVLRIGRPERMGFDWRVYQTEIEEGVRELEEIDAARARAPLPEDRGDAPAIVQKFNKEYPTEHMLELSGYVESLRPAPHGCSDWRSPYQTSKTYATRVYPDGRWVSLSMSDYEHGVGPNNGKYCFGDAFDLYVHYNVQAENEKMPREQAYARGIELLEKTPTFVEQSVYPTPIVIEDTDDDFAGIAPKSLGDAAKIGFIGGLLTLCNNRTEATEAGIVFQFLSWVGAIASGHRFVTVGERHYSNIFTILVGTTSLGRKGTANSIIRDLFHEVHPSLLRLTASIIASGEGLLHRVKDPQMEQTVDDQGEPMFDRFNNPVMQIVPDQQINDKRLLVNTSEAISLFAVMGRENNTLSGLMREAWDCTQLSIVRRDGGRGGDVATDPHIGLCGNITPVELLKMKDAERHNGFANRCLFAYSRRDKIIPFPERISFKMGYGLELANWLRRALEVPASSEVYLRPEAIDVWTNYFAYELEKYPASVQHFLHRQRAQCLRVALIYAILDCSSYIEVHHLHAAYEILRYSRDTVLMQFGLDEAISDDAEYLLNFIKGKAPDGATRSEIVIFCNRAWSKKRVDLAIGELIANDRIRAEKPDRFDDNGKPLAGRKTTWYFSI